MRALLTFLLATNFAFAQNLLDLPDDSLQVRKIAEDTYLVSIKDSVYYAQKRSEKDKPRIYSKLSPFEFYVHIAPKTCVSWADDSTDAHKELKIPFFMRKRTYHLQANYQTQDNYIWIVDNLHHLYGLNRGLYLMCIVHRDRMRELDTQSYHARIAQFLGARIIAYPKSEEDILSGDAP